MQTPRILVVEDERIVALHLRQQLIKLGYEVPGAAVTGDQALRGIEESRPDLVLMDIHIKGAMDGIATASRIPPAYRIPVIYLTAYSEEATLRRASTTNPYGYLLKPFSERELHAMIQVTLARCRAEHAAHNSQDQEAKVAATGSQTADRPVSWGNTETTLFAAISSDTGTILFRLIVEPLPSRHEWDWAVWQPDGTALHGATSSAVVAMEAAEAAVRNWDQATGRQVSRPVQK